MLIDSNGERELKKIRLLRKCPICGNSKGKLLCRQAFALFEEDIFPDEYNVVFCCRCGLVFHDSKAQQADYEYYYDNLSKYDDENTARGGGACHVRDRHNQVAEYLSIFISKDAKILDIGCANGGMLEVLQEKGFKNLHGMDITQKSVQNTRKKGFRAFCGSLSSSKLDEKFELILVSHVMEHVFNIKLAMENIYKWLLKDGQVYLEVPDGTMYSENFLAPFSHFSLEHINHFGKVSLVSLMKISGFAFSAYRSNSYKIGKYFPIQSIIGRKIEKESYSIDDIPFDYELTNNMIKYIAVSEEKRNFDCLDKYMQTKEPVVLWGAGHYSQQLLANSKLRHCNIVAIVDNDLKMKGKRLNNIEVSLPTRLKEIRYPIVVCTASFNYEILKEIDEMKLPNTVILIE